MSDAKQCSNCRHSFVMVNPQDPTTSPLICRRYPPTTHLMVMQAKVATAQNGGMTQVPQSIPVAVQANWSCGEHDLMKSGLLSALSGERKS